MSSPPKRHRGSAFGAYLAACALLCLWASVATAADSPFGDHAAPWPGAWRPYVLSGGAKVSDVIGDVGCGQGYCDVSSGSSGTLNSVYFASDGTNVFFRIRVLSDPRKASAGGFMPTTWMLQIAVGGVARVAVGLDGKNPQRDFVYVANADGTAHTEVYATPFNNAGGEDSAGARGLPDGEGQYFLDWQVPLSRITQRSGGAITAYTPVRLFFGTSQSANLAVLNKDYMVGSSVNFGSGSTVTLVVRPPLAPAAPAPGATPWPRGAAASPTPVLEIPNTRQMSPARPPELLLAAFAATGLCLGLIGLRRRTFR